MRMLSAILLAFMLLTSAFAQEQSLGDAARQARQNKQPKTTTTVIDNDTLARQQGPIPDISLKGPENTDEICAAIEKLRQKQQPSAEFESAVHEWYTRHDEMLMRIYRDQALAGRLQRDRFLPQMNPYHNDDYNKYKEARVMETLNASVERDIAMDTNMAINRLQQVLTKVRIRLQAMQLRYDWFKIRYNNGSY